MGVARDTYPRDGGSFSFVAGFAEVEVDMLERAMYRIVDYTAVADSGTIIHPRSFGGQVLGRSVLGMGHALAQKTVYDQHYGLPLATLFYQNRPPTILGRSDAQAWEALNIPDPDMLVGAQGIGENPWRPEPVPCSTPFPMRWEMTCIAAHPSALDQNSSGARTRAAHARSVDGAHST